jgi:hypothetical protein
VCVCVCVSLRAGGEGRTGGAGASTSAMLTGVSLRLVARQLQRTAAATLETAHTTSNGRRAVDCRAADQVVANHNFNRKHCVTTAAYLNRAKLNHKHNVAIVANHNRSLSLVANSNVGSTATARTWLLARASCRTSLPTQRMLCSDETRRPPRVSVTEVVYPKDPKAREGLPLVEVYTTMGCSLCDDAAETLRGIRRIAPHTLVKQDITDHQVRARGTCVRAISRACLTPACFSQHIRNIQRVTCAFTALVPD